MNSNKVVGIVMLAVLIGGCASERRQGRQIESYFVTDIDQQGSKRFSYSVTMSAPEKGHGQRKGGRDNGAGRGNGVGGGQRGGDRSGNPADMTDKIKIRMTGRLETKLAETGFCREGYFELDSYFSRSRSYIKGECKEGANDLDRTEYVNGAVI